MRFLVVAQGQDERPIPVQLGHLWQERVWLVWFAAVYCGKASGQVLDCCQ